MVVWFITSIFEYMVHGLLFISYPAFWMLEANKWGTSRDTLFLLHSLFLYTFSVITSQSESEIRFIMTNSRIRKLALRRVWTFVLNLKPEVTEIMGFVPNHPERYWQSQDKNLGPHRQLYIFLCLLSFIN